MPMLVLMNTNEAAEVLTNTPLLNENKSVLFSLSSKLESNLLQLEDQESMVEVTHSINKWVEITETLIAQNQDPNLPQLVTKKQGQAAYTTLTRNLDEFRKGYQTKMDIRVAAMTALLDRVKFRSNLLSIIVILGIIGVSALILITMKRCFQVIIQGLSDASEQTSTASLQLSESSQGLAEGGVVKLVLLSKYLHH
jgi:hypothetical protein